MRQADGKWNDDHNPMAVFSMSVTTTDLYESLSGVVDEVTSPQTVGTRYLVHYHSRHLNFARSYATMYVVDLLNQLDRHPNRRHKARFARLAGPGDIHCGTMIDRRSHDG